MASGTFRSESSRVSLTFRYRMEQATRLTWQRSFPHSNRPRDFHPDIVFFQAGVDALESDKLGRLSLTREGLARRDNLVYQFVSDLKVPLVQTLGGGYSEPIDLTVEAHAQSFRIAAEYFQR